MKDDFDGLIRLRDHAVLLAAALELLVETKPQDNETSATCIVCGYENRNDEPEEHSGDCAWAHLRAVVKANGWDR